MHLSLNDYNFSDSNVDYHICLETTTEKISLEIEQAMLLSPEKKENKQYQTEKEHWKAAFTHGEHQED